MAAFRGSAGQNRALGLQRSHVVLPQVVNSLAGVLFPKVGAVFPLAHRRIELDDEILVVLVDHVIQETGSNPVTICVACPIRIAGPRSGRLWLIEEPADIVGNALNEPAGVPRSAAPAAVLLC